MHIELKRIDRENFDAFFRILSAMTKWAGKGIMIEKQKEMLAADYFHEPARFEGFVAYSDGKEAGFVSFFQGYATMDARTTMYIEDIFVLEKFQEKGVGKALMSECFKIAKERGYCRVDLLSFGEKPKKFYEKLGGEWHQGNFHYRWE